MLTALLVCTPADRESERAGRVFLLRIHRSISTDWVGGKRGVSVSLNLSGDSLSTRTSGSGVRAHGTYCFLCIRHSICKDWIRGEAEEVPTSLILSGSVFINMSAGREQEPMTFFFHALWAIPFFWSGKRRLMVMVAPYTWRQHFWYACQRIRKRAPVFFIYYHEVRGLEKREAGAPLHSAAAPLVCMLRDRGRARGTFFPFALPPFHFQGLGEGG